MDYGPEIETYAGKTIGLYGGKFFPLHKGHIRCILEAQSYVDILFVTVAYDDEHEAFLSQKDGFEIVEHQVRERWLSEELKDFPNIRVTSYYEPRSDDYMNDDRIFEVYENLIKEIGGKVDVVFSNEEAYTEYYEKYVPNAKHHILFDGARDNVQVSATAVRQNGVYAYWDFLPPAVQKFYTKRVALCGIESVGKTHLSRMLAKHFSTVTVPEYGRTFYDNLNGFSDISNHSDYTDIAVGHLHTSNLLTSDANKILLLDTDMIYTQYFHVRAHGEKHPILDSMIRGQLEKIDYRFYIEPFNEHELDGTRNKVTDMQRLHNNLQLKGFYAEYGVDLILVSEESRAGRFEALRDGIASIINT